MAVELWRSLQYKILPYINYVGIRTLSTVDNGHRIVASDDGNTVVCWHPEIDFPYEKSLPIDLNREESEIFNVQNSKEIMDVLNEKKREYMMEKLVRLTHTTKHRWVPEGIHKRRRKRDFEENRPYL